MPPFRRSKRDRPPRHIELKLRDIHQLFNTMDPSPFHEKDLDADAEEFILNWMREFPLDEPSDLVVHLSQLPTEGNPQAIIEQAIHNYFRYRRKLNRLELRQLFKRGRQSLTIGLPFLITCLLLGQLAHTWLSSTPAALLSESLTIAGWVAMWRPMQIYLYDWWPVRHEGKLLEKMSSIRIRVKQRTEKDKATNPAVQFPTPQ